MASADSGANQERLSSLQSRLGHRFVNTDLLANALTHSSFTNESAGSQSNERMEFLGDSILSFVSAQYLYNNYPQNEGKLSRLRSVLVSENSLYKVAEEYGVQKCMGIGGSLKVELARTGRIPRSILADCVEALIAGVFLDGGYDSAFSVVMRMIDYLVNSSDVFEDSDDMDYKSLLQEYVQKKTHKLPDYECRQIDCSGKQSSDVFEVTLKICGKMICRNTSSSIRKAQKACAKEAYEKISSGEIKL